LKCTNPPQLLPIATAPTTSDEREEEEEALAKLAMGGV
jgi:hypothetical protein